MKQLGNVISVLISTILITLFFLMVWYGFDLTVGQKHSGVYIEIHTTGWEDYFLKGK